MTAALKPPPTLTTCRHPNVPKLHRVEGSDLTKGEHEMLDAVASLRSQGLPATDANLCAALPHLPIGAIWSRYRRMAKRGLLPDRTSQRGGGRKPVLPCSRCGDKFGARDCNGHLRRYAGETWGVKGKVCSRCWKKLRGNTKADRLARGEATPPPKPVMQRAEVILKGLPSPDVGEIRLIDEDYKRPHRHGTKGRASFMEGFVELRAVAAEQAARLLTLRSQGFAVPVEPTAREVAAKCVAEHKARWKRLREHASYCRVSFT